MAQSVKTASSGDGISLLTSLLSSVNSRAIAKRALFSNVPLELGPGFRISVKGYIIFKPQEPRRTAYIWLKGEKAQLVKGVTQKQADDTSRNVERAEIRKAYKFGGEQISFTPDEATSLRRFGDSVIRFIGFKPSNYEMLPIWANLKTPTFIYPSEEGFIGSTRVFSALYKKLLKDKKMGLVWFIARKNATPVIAALVPGEEKIDDNGDQKIPQGLWLIPLPYADDIRINPPITLVVAPNVLIDKMRIVIQQLQLPKGQYIPSNYPNPGKSLPMYGMNDKLTRLSSPMAL